MIPLSQRVLQLIFPAIFLNPIMFRFSSKRVNEIPSVGSMQDLEALFIRDEIVLFKHSPTCALSLSAYREVARLQEVRPDAPVHLISVRSERALARYVAERTGIPHESPQVIILRKGEVIAAASHWQIACDSLAELLTPANQIASGITAERV